MENIPVPTAEKSGPGKRLARRFGDETTHSTNAVRACSACAGDYEDPDRTAWGDDENIEPEDSEAADDRSQTE